MTTEKIVVTSKETSDLIASMRKFGKATVNSSARSKDFLVKAGIYTPKGNLKKAYR
jgi:hypothetical protein